jgi:hypothetical protein
VVNGEAAVSVKGKGKGKGKSSMSKSATSAEASCEDNHEVSMLYNFSIVTDDEA